MNEEELIQEQIEKGTVPNGIDADAYRLVFSALKKDTNDKLSDDFAKRVSSLAFTRKKSFDWDKFFLFTGLFTLVVALVYAVIATGFAFSMGSLQFLSNYSYFVIFAIGVVALLQWIDRKILKTTTQF